MSSVLRNKSVVTRDLLKKLCTNVKVHVLRGGTRTEVATWPVWRFKQAQYVLSNDSSVQMVGWLMANGDYWVYREVPRTIAEIDQIEEQIRDAHGKDTTYSPSPEPTNSSSSYAREPSPPSYPFMIRQDTESEAFPTLQEALPASMMR